MFSNLLKTLSKTCKRPIVTYKTRYISSFKETKELKDHEDADIKIEASIFDNSSIRHEPVKKSDVLKNINQAFVKKKVSNNISSKPDNVNIIKKTPSERKIESEIIHDESLGLQFLRLSLNDPRLSTLLVTVRSKKRRDKDRQIVIEGRRLILEALSCGLKLNSVIFSKKEYLSEIKENIAHAQKQHHTIIYKVPQHDLKTWSTLTTPPGVMAIFDRPGNTDVKGSTFGAALPITVVCDNIREPNNLGSIIRTCAALPCLQVVVTCGCCDPWESKALRGGCGGHFRLPIRDGVKWEDVPLMIPPEVADNCSIFVAENNFNKLVNMPMAEYSEVEKVGLHNIIVIGGETHGVSEDAYRFMKTVGEKGKCLYIPLAQGIDSLNVASALTLILYELRKNILKSNIFTEHK